MPKYTIYLVPDYAEASYIVDANDFIEAEQKAEELADKYGMVVEDIVEEDGE